MLVKQCFRMVHQTLHTGNIRKETIVDIEAQTKNGSIKQLIDACSLNSAVQFSIDIFQQ